MKQVYPRLTTVLSRHVLVMGCFAGLLAFYYASTVPSSAYYAVLAIAASVLLLECVYGFKKLQQLVEIMSDTPCVHGALCKTLSVSTVAIHNKHSINKILLVIFYAFFAKFFGERATLKSNQFSSEKTANRSDVYWMVALSQLPTLPLIHLFIETEANAPVAWLITGLTLWSVIYYLAQVQGVKHIPSSINNDILNYRFGFTWSADIPLSNIKSLKKLSFNDDQNIDHCFSSPFGASRNLLVEFEQPVTFYAYYGLNKKCRSAIISIDRPDALISQITTQKMEDHSDANTR